MKILGYNCKIRYGSFGFYIDFDGYHQAICNYIEFKYKINDWNEFLNNLHFCNFYAKDRVIPEFKLENDAKRLAILLSSNLLIDIR